MSIVLKNVILLTLFLLIKYVVSDTDNTPKGDVCPAQADEDQPCYFYIMDVGKLIGLSTHARQCEYDVFMSLCAIVDPDMENVDELWEFMCSSINYNLGCRYCYAYCATGDTVNFQNGEVPELKTMLAWYDAFVMGGKFSLCDMDNTTVKATVADPCIQTSQDALRKCTVNLQSTFYQGFQSSTPANCSDMNTRIECFLDVISANECPREVHDIFMRYFQGVVSMSPCVGKIPAVPGGSVGLLASKLTIALAILLIPIINYL